MKLVLCPRCELNYMGENEQYCKVCQRELHGDTYADEVEMCSICNESPALPGRDICLFCLKEMNQQAGEEEENQEQEPTDTSNIGDMDSVAQMDEILPEMEDNSGEFSEMADELSLESVQEEEEQEQNKADSEDEDL